MAENSTHLIASLVVGLGPKNDSPDFLPALDQAAARICIGRLLADGAYDAEAHHRHCREELGIAKTIIPLNPRGHPDTVPKTPYRRAMKLHFPWRQYAQRWQIESAISRLKRRVGSALSARTDITRQHDCQIHILTHNLMILWLPPTSVSTEQRSV